VWVVVPTGDGGEESASPSAPGLVQIDRSPGDGPLKAGEAVPSFSAPDLEGGTISWSRFRGSPTVLAIWAAWCPHCQKELPILDAAVDQHPGVRFATIVTSLGANPGPSPQQYMADRGLSFPVAVDDARGTLARGLGIRGFPSVYFVDASGVVRRATEGEVDGAVLQDSIAEIAER
jgi:peroxiredoxin